MKIINRLREKWRLRKAAALALEELSEAQTELGMVQTKYARLPLWSCNDESQLHLLPVMQWKSFLNGAVQLFFLGDSHCGTQSNAILKGRSILPVCTTKNHSQEVTVIDGILRINGKTYHRKERILFQPGEKASNCYLDGIVYLSWVPALESVESTYYQPELGLLHA